MLHTDNNRKGSVPKKKKAYLGSRAWSKDELIGGKPPVVILTLSTNWVSWGHEKFRDSRQHVRTWTQKLRNLHYWSCYLATTNEDIEPISTTSNFLKQKKLNILGYTWTDASPGTSTSLPKRNILASHSPKCTGCWARKSKLSISNKLLAYKVVPKPIWTYGIHLWGSASFSNIEILERFQAKVLRMITDAPWYVPNTVLRQDLQITSVKKEIRRFSTQYRARLYTHPNSLTVHFTVPPDHRRLRRHLPTRFHE
jgi:hypothetical protein